MPHEGPPDKKTEGQEEQFAFCSKCGRRLPGELSQGMACVCGKNRGETVLLTKQQIDDPSKTWNEKMGKGKKKKE